MGNFIHNWDYIKRNAGQLVTSAELENIGKYQRNTQLDYLSNFFRGKYTGNPRPGVIHGFSATAISAQVVEIAPGLGFVVQTTSGEPWYTAVVHEAAYQITLSAPDATHPRYDLIFAEQNEGLADYAVRSVRLSTGALRTDNLPGLMASGCTIDKIEGTPAASPVVPTCSPQRIPVAVVKVAPAAPDVISDVRSYLIPCSGETSEYRCMATLAAGNVLQAFEDCTDPSIQIVEAFNRQAAGQYRARITYPRAFGCLTGSSNYFQTAAFYHAEASVWSDAGSFAATIGHVNAVPPSALPSADSEVFHEVEVFLTVLQEAAGAFVPADMDGRVAVTLKLYRID